MDIVKDRFKIRFFIFGEIFVFVIVYVVKLVIIIDIIVVLRLIIKLFKMYLVNGFLVNIIL